VSTTAPTRPVSREPIDPRIRQRRAAVARGAGRRRLVRVLLAVLVVALGADAWFALHSSLLSARVVVVRGAVHTTRPEILAAGGLAAEPPLVDVDPGRASRALEHLPWVGRAVVTRQWPDQVTVTVTERVPKAVVERADRRWAEVDGTGRVLAVTAAPPAGLVHLGLPGPATTGTQLGPAAGPVLMVADTLPAAFAAQVATISSSPGGVDLTFTAPLRVELGPPVDLPAKYEDVAALLAGATLHDGDVIDVRVPGSPTVTSA